jgi:type II secretory pathway pseudopilin PulG
MLIDLLMAVAIVGIAAIATLEIITASALAGKHTQHVQAASNLCRERLEQIRNISGLAAGAGSNVGDPFLPDLNNVSVEQYFSGFYLTESDTYQASDGTPGSLSVSGISGRVDRVTQIEWVDDPGGGGTQDYYKVTVWVFWQEGGKTRSLSLETIVSVG